MKYYIELTVIDDGEINVNYLWEKVYNQLHIGFAEHETLNIGLSFPEYTYNSIGGKCRLFANSYEDLEQFDLSHWLNRLTDYVDYTNIRETPKVNSYSKYVRKQNQRSPEQAIKRCMKRKNISYEDAVEKYKDYTPKLRTEPFVKLKSNSNKNTFSLFIGKTAYDELLVGSFDCYGLSSSENGGTVPEF
jgi:CRISPR-associated endonuclease Csy4